MKAFPARNTTEQGMDLRDYFAAKAMQGLFSVYHDITPTEPHTMSEAMAGLAYELAEAMMKVREMK